jgi:hypothetical protein
VERLVREHLDGRSDQSRPLWGLLVFALWQERLGAAPSASRAAA